MTIRYFFCFTFLFVFNITASGQKVEWVKKFDRMSFDNHGHIKLDDEGNAYLANVLPENSSSTILTKLDNKGKLTWEIKLIDYYSHEDPYIEFTLDPAGNLYGMYSTPGFPDTKIEATNGMFNMVNDTDKNNHNAYHRKIYFFKIDKDGNFKWSKIFSGLNIHPYRIIYDKYRDTVYPLMSYAYYAKIESTTLHTIDTSHPDITPVSVFCALDAETGNLKTFKNLFLQSGGVQIIPLQDRLIYSRQQGEKNVYLHMDPEGVVFHNTSSIDNLKLELYLTLNVPFYIKTGFAHVDHAGYPYDFRNIIRKTDLYGDIIAEKHFSNWDTAYQTTIPVFEYFNPTPVDDQTLLVLTSGRWDHKVSFNGESLTENDYRFIFFDDKLNIKQVLPAYINKRVYQATPVFSQKDRALYVLFDTREELNIEIGETVINAPEGYHYHLAKITFDEIKPAKTSPKIISVLLDEQIKTAEINENEKSVTVFIGPGSKISSLQPKIYTSKGSKLKEEITAPIDLNSPKQITLLSQSGEQQWVMKVIKTYSEKHAIKSATLNQQISVKRDATLKEIEFIVPRETDLKNIHFADLKISEFATISPDPLSNKDFSSPRLFTVTAENGDNALWKISVKRELSKEKRIISLQVQDQLSKAKINDIDKEIDLELASYSDLKSNIKEILLSTGAELVNFKNEILDLSRTNTLEVKAEDGSIASWQIRASKASLNDLQQAVKVYPVPSYGSLTVEIAFIGREKAILELTTVDGRTILNKDLDTAPFLSYILNTSTYPAGIYMLSIKHANQVYRKKIIQN